jgi:hypothetical protein
MLNCGGAQRGLAVPTGFLAAVGYAASLPLQDRLIRSTDDAVQGQILGPAQQRHAGLAGHRSAQCGRGRVADAPGRRHGTMARPRSLSRSW